MYWDNFHQTGNGIHLLNFRNIITIIIIVHLNSTNSLNIQHSNRDEKNACIALLTRLLNFINEFAHIIVFCSFRVTRLFKMCMNFNAFCF